MPRELGKAKRADLTGHLPGEQAEYGSALARFLEGAGQLKPPAEGAGPDRPSGNGNATEIPGIQRARSSDTEVAPVPGNGRGNPFHATPDLEGDSLFGDADISPELAFDGQMEALTLEPVTFEPSADTLSPAAPEPEMLDSVPDLTSPELDEIDDEETHPPAATPELAPASSSDTGLLAAEAFGAGQEQPPEGDPAGRGDWTHLNLDADNDQRPTDKLGPRPAPSPAAEAAGVTADRRDFEEEKITSKVDPRRDVDPRRRDPDAVVRDTVNFYNQTQSLPEQTKRSSGFPTISPTVVNSNQPLGWGREQQPAPDLFSQDDAEALPPALFDLDAAGALNLDEGPIFEPISEPALSPAVLPAEAALDDADKRETDRFNREDREPPSLPLPEGTDKVAKVQPARGQGGARPGSLEPLADEGVAGGKDTQRFYVAEILAQKPRTGDTTAELQPAEEGIPPTADGSDSLHDYGTETWRGARRERTRGLEHEPEELPGPAEVQTDFIERVEVTHSDRIIPEIETEQGAHGDDTVDEEAVTPRPAHGRAGAHSPRSPAAARRGEREPRVSDSLARRMEQERAETLRLIEQAETVALRLREASEASRADLQALSERRAVVRQHPAPPDPDDLHELPAGSDEEQHAMGLISGADETVFDQQPPEPQVPTPAPRRLAGRVPTRAIGEIVDELQRTAEQPPASLRELLDQVSRRQPAVEANGREDETDDLDLLVAASARLRETVESETEPDRVSSREPVPRPFEAPASSRRAAAESTLAADLDRLWQVLDSRRASAATPATLVIPAPEHARITPREDQPLDGWTQEMLWPTLAGIAGVTFALGALFVWVLFRLLG